VCSGCFGVFYPLVVYLPDMQDRPNLINMNNVYLADMQDRPNMSDMNNVYLADMQDRPNLSNMNNVYLADIASSIYHIILVTFEHTPLCYRVCGRGACSGPSLYSYLI
jgi:hypothetical protein